MIALHNNLSDSFFHSARNVLFASAGESLVAPLSFGEKEKVAGWQARQGAGEDLT